MTRLRWGRLAAVAVLVAGAWVGMGMTSTWARRPFTVGTCVDARSVGSHYRIIHTACGRTHDGVVVGVLPSLSQCPGVLWSFRESPAGGVACVQFRDPTLAQVQPYTASLVGAFSWLGWYALIITVSVVLHELGHLVAALLVGGEVVELSLGRGRRLVGVSVGGVDVNLRAVPTGAHLAWHPRRLEHFDRMQVVVSSVGLAVTLALALGGLIGWSEAHNQVAAAVAVLNGMLFVGNAAPVKVGGRRTDGRAVADAVSGKLPPPPAVVAEAVWSRRQAGDIAGAEQTLAGYLGVVRARAPAWLAAATEALGLLRLGHYREGVDVLDRAAPCLAAAGAHERAVFADLLAHLILIDAMTGGPAERVPEALHVVESVTRVLPRTPGGAHTMILARLLERRDREAVELCRWCLRRHMFDYTRAAVLSMLAIALARTGDEPGARVALAEAGAVGAAVPELAVAAWTLGGEGWTRTGGTVMADNDDRLARIEEQIGQAKRRLATLRREGERHFIDDQPVDPTVTDALQQLIEEHERLNRLRAERASGQAPPPHTDNELDALEARIRRLREAEQDPHRSERHFIDD